MPILGCFWDLVIKTQKKWTFDLPRLPRELPTIYPDFGPETTDHPPWTLSQVHLAKIMTFTKKHFQYFAVYDHLVAFFDSIELMRVGRGPVL